MFANKFKININNFSGSSVTLNVPISMGTQNVDNAELIERVFVDTEVENAINPIIDYEKTRFVPIDKNGNQIQKITYDIRLLDQQGNYNGFYGSVGFTDDDIKFRKEAFKQTHVYLAFYDSDNPLTQNLITFNTLFSKLNSSDIYPFGTPNVVIGTAKPVSQIPINYILENPMTNKIGFSEGYHIYDYKSGLEIGVPKYLYMRASFRNAKTGKIVNLMVKNSAQPIEKLVKELYTRYKLIRTNTGFYYEIDDTYQGNNISGSNNVNYNNNTCVVTLYEIKAA